MSKVSWPEASAAAGSRSRATRTFGVPAAQPAANATFGVPFGLGAPLGVPLGALAAFLAARTRDVRFVFDDDALEVMTCATL